MDESRGARRNFVRVNHNVLLDVLLGRTQDTVNMLGSIIMVATDDAKSRRKAN